MVSDTAQAKNEQLIKRNLHRQGFETFFPMQKACSASTSAVYEYPAPTFDLRLQSISYAYAYAYAFKNSRWPTRTTTLLQPFQTFKNINCSAPNRYPYQYIFNNG